MSNQGTTSGAIVSAIANELRKIPVKTTRDYIAGFCTAVIESLNVARRQLGREISSEMQELFGTVIAATMDFKGQYARLRSPRDWVPMLRSYEILEIALENLAGHLKTEA